MEEFLIRLLQFLLSISLLVLLHEGGHFLFCKLFGVRVEKFYIFFDPSIFKWKGSIFKWKPKNSDTTYGMGWLPLGGYCKIAGMIDESFDTEQMKQPEQPWEFRAKPAWQRLLIMIGGVLVNFLLALFIYSMVLYYWGDDYLEPKNMSMGMKFNNEAKALGFQDGDILLSADGKIFEKYGVDIYRTLSTAKEVTVKRGNATTSVHLPGNLNLLDMLKTTPMFTSPLIPADIDSVFEESPAAAAGMHKGDRLLAINGHPIDSWNEYNYELGRITDVLSVKTTHADSLRERQMEVVFLNHEKGEADTAKIQLTPDLKMGVLQANLADYYEQTHRAYGFWESLPAGIGYGVDVLRGYVGDMKYVFTADGAKSLGGFGTIGSLFPPVWDWLLFWRMTAFLSIILAFMNILPIPALDGGHVLFLLYEMITRRKPSEKFMVVAEYVGFAILILLMVVANLNDILRWLGIM